MRVLYTGEIVGTSGVYCIKSLLPDIKKTYAVDFTIAGADGATGGYGIGKQHAAYLHKLGIDVLTGGECIYYKKDMVPHIAQAGYILRAANYPRANPGRGYATYSVGNSEITVIVLLGQSGFDRVHLDNPFLRLRSIVEQVRANNRASAIVVDFHANTTAEKNALFHYADGMASAIIGSHTKALSADARITASGTGVISDAGRTGSSNSVGGLDPGIEIEKLLTGIPERSKPAWEDLELQGVIVDIGEDGKATSIESIRIKTEVEQ